MCFQLGDALPQESRQYGGLIGPSSRSELICRQRAKFLVLGQGQRQPVGIPSGIPQGLRSLARIQDVYDAILAWRAAQMAYVLVDTREYIICVSKGFWIKGEEERSEAPRLGTVIAEIPGKIRVRQNGCQQPDNEDHRVALVAAAKRNKTALRHLSAPRAPFGVQEIIGLRRGFASPAFRMNPAGIASPCVAARATPFAEVCVSDISTMTGACVPAGMPQPTGALPSRGNGRHAAQLSECFAP